VGNTNIPIKIIISHSTYFLKLAQLGHKNRALSERITNKLNDSSTTRQYEHRQTDRQTDNWQNKRPYVMSRRMKGQLRSRVKSDRQ